VLNRVCLVTRLLIVLSVKYAWPCDLSEHIFTLFGAREWLLGQIFWISDVGVGLLIRSLDHGWLSLVAKSLVLNVV
jgi:hypothetical protein